MHSTNKRTSPFSGFKAVLCLLLFTLCLSYSQNSHAGDSKHDSMTQKSETELRLGLTASGFHFLLDTLGTAAATSGKREDMYFDVHENSKFLMRRLEPRAKLRIQYRTNECVMQKSWITEQHFSKVQYFTWSATTRSSAHLARSQKSETCQRWRTASQFLLAKVAEGKIKSSEIDAVEEFWKAQIWPPLPDFDTATAHLQGPLVPAAVVHKERWVIHVPKSVGKTVKIQLGKDSNMLTSSQTHSYELEVETKDSSIAAETETLAELSQYLARLGLRPEHTTSQKDYDFFATLENLYATGR